MRAVFVAVCYLDGKDKYIWTENLFKIPQRAWVDKIRLADLSKIHLVVLKWITRLKKERLRVPLVAHPRFPPIIPPDRESGTGNKMDAILAWSRSFWLRSYELYCLFDQSGVANLPTASRHQGGGPSNLTIDIYDLTEK